MSVLVEMGDKKQSLEGNCGTLQKDVMKRRTLQTIQPSAKSQPALVGSDGEMHCNKLPKENEKKRKRRDVDQSCSKSKKIQIAEQENFHRVAKDLVCTDPVSGGYWKQLAERRRVSLAEALVENRQLHKENKQLTEKIVELGMENEALKEMCANAEKLAEIVQILTEEGNESNNEEADEHE